MREAYLDARKRQNAKAAKTPIIFRMAFWRFWRFGVFSTQGLASRMPEQRHSSLIPCV
jgi:hypothetical protein